MLGCAIGSQLSTKTSVLFWIRKPYPWFAAAVSSATRLRNTRWLMKLLYRVLPNDRSVHFAIGPRIGVRQVIVRVVPL